MDVCEKVDRLFDLQIPIEVLMKVNKGIFDDQSIQRNNRIRNFLWELIRELTNGDNVI